ncbi:hypothetical protein N9F42_02955 [Pseudomonadales bacterium]|nr:hypothetical protein [Pseudomonadales bacterium]
MSTSLKTPTPLDKAIETKSQQRAAAAARRRSDKTDSKHRKAINSSYNNVLRRLCWDAARGWHMPFALKLGLAISVIAVLGAMALAYLGMIQYQRLLERQGDAFGEAIVAQLAGSLVEAVFTDDQLAIQLQLNQLAKKSAVYGVAVYLPSGELIAQSGSVGEQSLAADYSATSPDAAISMAIRLKRPELPAGHYMAPVNFSGADGAYAVVSVNRSPMRRVFYASARDLLFAVLLVCVISIVSAFIFSHFLSRPVYRLLAISKAAREGRVQDLPAGKGGGGRSAEWNNEWADILSIYAQLGHEVNSKREVEKLLQRFVASDVADQLLNGNEVLQLGGEVVEASVLFVDIVEYTRMSESMLPDEVARMLNQYLSIFTSCARIYRGTVDKFIGDAAMIVFGAPRADKDHRLQAMSCANAIRLVASRINEKREDKGLNRINLRVGVNSGLMQAGILGSEYRMEYTVVGDAVNLASRLCDAAQPGEALVSESVYNNGFYTEVKAENAGLVAVKGKEEMVNVYRIQSVNEPKGWMLAGLIEDLVSAHE